MWAAMKNKKRKLARLELMFEKRSNLKPGG
jgi:hypothetical protein